MKRNGILALVIAFSLLTMAVLVGCANNPSPSDVTKASLEAIKSGDGDTLNANYSGDSSDVSALNLGKSMEMADESGLTEDQKAVMTSLEDKFRDFDYEITDEQIDGDKATVTVQLSTYDLGNALSTALSDYMSQAIAMAFSNMGSSSADTDKLTEIFFTAFQSKLDDAKEKTKVSTVDLTLTKDENGAWKMDELSSEAKDALTGGVISSLAAFNEQFSSGN